MDEIYLELKAANKNCTKNFKEVAKTQYHNCEIFEYALEYVNSSSSFRRTGKTLYLEEITDDSIIIRLTSETPLQIASKSLAGFSRKLLSIDKELGLGIFDDFIYNNTLFRNSELPTPNALKVNQNMSDATALKLCVDVFCGEDITTSKEEQMYMTHINKAIKDILFQYSRRKRLKTYATKVTTLTMGD